MSRSLKIKLLVIGILVAVFLVGWFYDYMRAKEYNVEITYVSDTTPYANEYDFVTIEVLVTRNGKPCVGHEIEIRCDKGRFDPYMDITDENGCVRFEYIPYYESEWAKAGPVKITVLELSNSLFIEVNVVKEFNIIEVQPLG